MNGHSSNQMKGAKSNLTVKFFNFFFKFYIHGYYQFWRVARVVTKYWTGILI